MNPEIEFKPFPKIARFSREVIVTEKIDGTNASIWIGDDGQMLVGSRTRWITPDNDNFGFAKWAHEHRDELLQLGPGHHFGEWWGSGIQRGYGLTNGERRFSLFNVGRWAPEGATARPSCCGLVPVLWRGKFDDLDTEKILADLTASGSQAASGFMNPEGIVIHHVAACMSFKKTIDRDEEPKGLAKSRNDRTRENEAAR